MTKPSRPRDPNQKAKLIVEIATGERSDDRGKNAAAVSLGKLGGVARAKKLTPQRRKAIAKKAARKRWGKK